MGCRDASTTHADSKGESACFAQDDKGFWSRFLRRFSYCMDAGLHSRGTGQFADTSRRASGVEGDDEDSAS